MNITAQKPISLLVRVPLVAEPVEAIANRHNALASSDGNMWFGIRGRVPSQTRRACLLQQVDRGISTYLYLLQRNGSRFHGFRALLRAFSETPPDNSMIPEYYYETGLAQSIALWAYVKCFREVDNRTIDTLRVDQTGTPIGEALARSMVGVMVVSG
jgi:hypothetical protein